MSTAIILCDGCSKTFTLTGHEKHLRLTSKPACAALRQRIRSQDIDSDASDHDGDDDSDSGDDSPPSSPPQAFTSDAFGEYDDAYWDQYDEYQPAADPDDEDEDENGADGDFQPPATPPSDDEDDFDMQEDEDEDATNLEAEQGWEPPIDVANPTFGEEDGDQPDDHTNDLEGEPGPDRRTQRRAHQQLRTQTHIVPYPDRSAGAPIIPTDLRIPEAAGYGSYTSAPGQESSADLSNPYAPFRSRLEFEIARWAKMRGPGSNAVTELLSIEGVRSFTAR